MTKHNPSETNKPINLVTIGGEDVRKLSETNVDLPICHKCGATLLLFDEHYCRELEYPAYHLREVTEKVEESKLNTLSSGFGHKDILPETNEANSVMISAEIVKLMLEEAKRKGRKEMMGDILKACADGKATLTLDIKKMFPEEVK